jgi:LuxR family maltose regulon positive regulatory protein
MLDLYHGELDAVEETARKMIAIDETAPMPVYVGAYAPYLLGVVALERDFPAEAEERFLEVDERRHLTNTRLSIDALVGLALVAERRSDRKAMASWVSEARAFAVETRNRTSLEVVESLEARLASLAGNGTLPSIRVATDLDAISCWLEVPALTHAETLLRHVEAETRRMVLSSVEEQLALAKKVHNHRHLVRLLVMRAEGLAEAGRWEEALEVLEEALRRAERQQMVRPFLGGGPLRPRILESLAVRIGRSPFLERVCRAVSTYASAHGGRAAAGDTSTSSTSGIALTLREIETLELLARRLTNKEIAARLSVTSAAVKKRLEGIYAKLDVHSRREAVAAAVALGIIHMPPR